MVERIVKTYIQSRSTIEQFLNENDEPHYRATVQELEEALSIFFLKEDRAFLTALGFYDVALTETVTFSYAEHHFSFNKPDGSTHLYIKSPKSNTRYFAIDEEIKVNGSTHIIFYIRDCKIEGNEITAKRLYTVRITDIGKKPLVYGAILRDLIKLDHTEAINATQFTL